MTMPKQRQKAKTMVEAIGVNILPSTPSSENNGMKTITMMEKLDFLVKL